MKTFTQQKLFSRSRLALIFACLAIKCDRTLTLVARKSNFNQSLRTTPANDVESRPLSRTINTAIAFITNRRNFEQLIATLGEEWFHQVENEGTDVYVMVGGASKTEVVQHPHLMNVFLFKMNCRDDEYPPFDKTATFFAQLNLLFPKGDLPYNWILVSDADTYIRPDTIRKLSERRDPKDRYYLGRPLHHCFCNAEFKQGDKCDLQSGIHYCSGMAYLLSRGSLDHLHGRWPGLQHEFVDSGMLDRCHSSDTFVGWAMSRGDILCERAIPLHEANSTVLPPSGISWGAPNQRGIKTKQETTFCQNRHHQGGVFDVGNLGKTYLFQAQDFLGCLAMHPLKNSAQFRYVHFAKNILSGRRQIQDLIGQHKFSPLTKERKCRIGIGVFAVRNKPVSRDAIRTTWKSLAEALPGIQTYFIIARSKESLPDHDELSLLREIKMNQDIVELDMVDSYELLYKKTIKFFQWGIKNTNCDYLFKTDDDSYVRTLPLLNFINSIERRDPRITHRYFGRQWGTQGGKLSPVVKDPKDPWYNHDLYPHDFYPPYMSGTGYGLSRHLVQDILSIAGMHPNYRCEDSGVGILVDAVRKGGRQVGFYTDSKYFGFECEDDMIVDNPTFSDGFNFYNNFQNDIAGQYCKSRNAKRKFLGGHCCHDDSMYSHPRALFTSPELPWDRNSSFWEYKGADPPMWKFIKGMKQFYDTNTVTALSLKSSQFVSQAVNILDRQAQTFFSECFNKLSYKDVFSCPDYAWSRTDVALLYRCAVEGKPRLMLAYGSFASNQLVNSVRVGLAEESSEVAMIVPFAGDAARLASFLKVTAKHFVEYGTLAKKIMILVCGLLETVSASEQCDNNPVFIEHIKKFEAFGKGKVTVKVIQVAHFSRSATLNVGISTLSDSTTAILMDIDCEVQRTFFDKALGFVRQGHSVYFPIVFSRYNLKSIDVSRHEHVRMASNDSFYIHPDVGSWRTYGFGMLSATVADLKAVGMFNEGFTEWGDEDYDIWKRFLKANYQVWRVFDPSIVHTYHPKACQFAKGNADKYKVCMQSKYSNEGTAYQLGMRMETEKAFSF